MFRHSQLGSGKQPEQPDTPHMDPHGLVRRSAQFLAPLRLIVGGEITQMTNSWLITVDLQQRFCSETESCRFMQRVVAPSNPNFQLSGYGIKPPS